MPAAVVARDRYSPGAGEARSSLNVVDVVRGDVFRGYPLQQFADIPRPLADHVCDDLGRRRDPESVDIAFDESGEIDCRFAKGLWRRSSGGRDGSTRQSF